MRTFLLSSVLAGGACLSRDVADDFQSFDFRTIIRRDGGLEMRHRLLALLSVAAIAVVVVSLVAVRVAAQAPKPAASKVTCADLTKLTSEGNTTITAATSVPAGTFTTPAGQTLTGLPAFCRVVGVSRPTSDSNINFEVWLPSDSWNGKF